MIELELYRCFRQARRSGVLGQRCNRTLHHRVAVGSGRDDLLAGSVKDEGSAVRADSLVLQQRNVARQVKFNCRRAGHSCHEYDPGASVARSAE
jgi:hypothetical protein